MAVREGGGHRGHALAAAAALLKLVAASRGSRMSGMKSIGRWATMFADQGATSQIEEPEDRAGREGESRGPVVKQ
jgi:hypothetical protein